MRTTAEVALRRSRSAEEYRQALEDVLHEAERTSTLVEDLLTLTRGDAGLGAFPLAPLNLAALVDDMRAEITERCHAGGLQAVIGRANESLMVLGDRAALRRLIRLLVDNAVKYTPAPGTVRLALEAEPASPGGRMPADSAGPAATVSMVIGDTGIGIPAEDLPRVFDRFYRADKARSRDSGGAGLGLSIARWIVDQHHGAILIESEPGNGTRVRVTLREHAD
jgi:signal transduction histidine kinase